MTSIEMRLADVEKGQGMHEAVCAERWKQILDRMSRMEKILYSAGASLIVGMATVIWLLLQRVAHL